MKARTVLMVSIVLSVAAIIIGLILEPQMPDPMAIHWDGQGQPNGFGSRFMGIWFTPLLAIGLILLLLGVPFIDPLKKNIDQFRNQYHIFILVVAVFCFVVQISTLLSNLDIKINLLIPLIPLIGGFIFYLGEMLEKAKQNYFIGVRTPWTLADESVWNETHRVAGRGLKISGLIAVLSLVLPNKAIWLMVGPALLVLLYSIVYSYFAYRKRHPAGE
jgi:uncharacterized membrane protein